MIFPIAPIYGFFFRSVPIIEPVQDARTDRTGTLEPDAPAWRATESLETRWVLKGYEWRPVAVWLPMVNPGWDHCVDNDPAEIHDRAVRAEEERAVRRLEPPVPLRREPHEPARLEPAQRHEGDARARAGGAGDKGPEGGTA
ncbi:hypothetical protein [Azohydromonas caseinilytica]|uniref:Uncharacterized protein n=1 Tax=Azohydromonas caseinilytica TaxID=2728836 RepID=A0A848FL24_9BURK|nr:hypothetical protein [Azohydromonas caseinilytica]NML18501.1 hypothetical protein [Azohydromonas caseinilytica]